MLQANNRDNEMEEYHLLTAQFARYLKWNQKIKDIHNQKIKDIHKSFDKFTFLN